MRTFGAVVLAVGLLGGMTWLQDQADKPRTDFGAVTAAQASEYTRALQAQGHHCPAVVDSWTGDDTRGPYLVLQCGPADKRGILADVKFKVYTGGAMTGQVVANR